jgi:glycosyltransferase involved in cell wall biosynthesis
VSDLVSVVIPVFNAERYLAETLASVSAQTYRTIEVVVVDDGSTDRSVAIARDAGERVVVVPQENLGPAAARNRGARTARGRWIAFLDADDTWAPDKIERQLATCGHLPWSHTDSVFVGGANDGRRDSALTPKSGGAVLEPLVRGNFICTSSVVVDRDVLLTAGGFDESLRSIQDWDLWLRIAASHALGYVDEPLVGYRVHPVSVSRRTRANLANHLRVIDRAFAAGGPATALAALKPAAQARSLGICSQIAEEEGDYAFAWSCSARAWARQPFAPNRLARFAKISAKWLLNAAGVRR